MKILILGHGGCGKNTACDYLKELSGITSLSSSEFAAEHAVFPVLSKLYGYETIQECYEDRRNHREEWRKLISEYNTPDKSRLAREILAKADCYNGMRQDDEYQATKHLFELILWIDASKRVPADPTLNIKFDPGRMLWIDNNGGKELLKIQLGAL